MRKTLGTIVAVATALSLIGVAWASDDVGAEADLQGETAVSSSITISDDSSSGTGDDSTSTSINDGGSTDTTLTDATSSTLDDDEDTTTSTTLDDDQEDADDSKTSTTLDREDDDDDSADQAIDFGVHTYAVAGVGEVTIEVLSDGLRLVSVNAPGWTIEIDKAESDKIEIEFRRGEEEAEFEAELHSNGGLSIEIDQD